MNKHLDYTRVKRIYNTLLNTTAVQKNNRKEEDTFI